MLLTSYDRFTRDFDRLAQRVYGTTNGGALSRRSVKPMDTIRRRSKKAAQIHQICILRCAYICDTM